MWQWIQEALASMTPDNLGQVWETVKNRLDVCNGMARIKLSNQLHWKLNCSLDDRFKVIYAVNMPISWMHV